ncbi:hypothetical protein [Phycicoccus duodecadis]|uniref:Excreted virulence factor EspC (Type VII ESX diderm) n=1 Tax=Phycicoccus duodecadis TaxID=173053 RepID=A0A2N3YMQ3_9MICO|nr:hypothetical protein [Phycicoccus duodecadis]PKW28116.1 hypothetical protein ATL31_2972 [Phycicoccus duodecadis]
MTLQADLDALRDDATLWDGVSDALGTARAECAGLTLSAHELTGVADRNGLVALYEQVRSTVATLFDEGSTSTGDVAAALLDVRHQYQTDDEAARRRLAGAWDPK